MCLWIYRANDQLLQVHKTEEILTSFDRCRRLEIDQPYAPPKLEVVLSFKSFSLPNFSLYFSFLPLSVSLQPTTITGFDEGIPSKTSSSQLTLNAHEDMTEYGVASFPETRETVRSG